MSLGQNLSNYFHKYFSIPSISIIDIIEMLIIAVVFYYLIKWFKRTSAWLLVKGIIAILAVWLLAAMFNFSTIVWIISKAINVGIIALIVIFQPELRRALEQLGQRMMLFRNVRKFSNSGQRFTDENKEEIVKAVMEMSRLKTGALISIEKNSSLNEFIHTGIEMNADISSQLILNIFVDKTPLHDGAVIIRNNKIAAATCYFPLSASRQLNKKYGTRHRAALGISEQTDAFTIVVSEETGRISLAVEGVLIEDIDEKELRNRLSLIQNNQTVTTWFDKFRKGGIEDEDQGDHSEIRSE